MRILRSWQPHQLLIKFQLTLAEVQPRWMLFDATTVQNLDIFDACKRPNRPPGACFKCYQMGHNFRDCPKTGPRAARYAGASVVADGVSIRRIAGGECFFF
uniref:CCHC-type domain-containing protein n=1 Tax=Anopheles minimus TaxID=112268 RepID=A0A182WN29_9DIPT